LTDGIDSQIMKMTLAIFFSLALVLTQCLSSLGAADANARAPQKPCCCGMAKPCCGTKAPADSPAVPAVPTPVGGTSQLQLAPPASCLVFSLADLPSTKLCFPTPALLKAGAVSLYQRNCAYLI